MTDFGGGGGEGGGYVGVESDSDNVGTDSL